jgi:hypothetical protein
MFIPILLASFIASINAAATPVKVIAPDGFERS